MGSERIGAILAALLRRGARRSGSPRPWIGRSGSWRIGTQRLGIGLRVALVGLGAALLLLEPVAAAEGLPAAGPGPVVTTTAPRQASPPAANASPRPAARSGAPVDATATVTAATATPAAASATAANNLAATASAASATNLPAKAAANVSAAALDNANILSDATTNATAHGTTRAPAATTPLERRLEQWPHWRLPAPLPRPGRGAPLWPAWFAGDWLVLDLSALDPSAAESSATLPTAHGGAPSWQARFHADGRGGTVADRAFNAAAAGRALLGDRLLSVQDDPSDPRRQLARLQGDQLLETTLVGQRGEEPSAGLFWNDELSLQVLHGRGEPRVSRVETLGRWQQRPDGGIDGEQWQARYGSPADGLRAEPVATERLRLRLVPAGPGSDPAS